MFLIIDNIKRSINPLNRLINAYPLRSVTVLQKKIKAVTIRFRKEKPCNTTCNICKLSKIFRVTGLIYKGKMTMQRKQILASFIFKNG